MRDVPRCAALLYQVPPTLLGDALQLPWPFLTMSLPCWELRFHDNFRAVDFAENSLHHVAHDEAQARSGKRSLVWRFCFIQFQPWFGEGLVKAQVVFLGRLMQGPGDRKMRQRPEKGCAIARQPAQEGAPLPAEKCAAARKPGRGRCAVARQQALSEVICSCAAAMSQLYSCIGRVGVPCSRAAEHISATLSSLFTCGRAYFAPWKLLQESG